MSVTASPAVDRHPLSVGQRRMWFLQARDPEDTTLNICVAYRLSGALDVARLRAAVDTVAARHDVLRTTYGVDAEGEPYQVRSEGISLPWQTHDVSGLPPADRARRVAVLARREFARSFDLAAEPPLRPTLVRTAATEHVLLLAVHRICWDDDSWPVFFAEVDAAYNGHEMAALPARFIDIEVTLAAEVNAAAPANAAARADINAAEINAAVDRSATGTADTAAFDTAAVVNVAAPAAAGLARVTDVVPPAAAGAARAAAGAAPAAAGAAPGTDDTVRAAHDTVRAAHDTARAADSAARAADDTDDAAAVAYWRSVLRPLPDPLLLPGSAVMNPSKRADRATIALPRDLLDRVDSYARDHAATPFAVLLAAYAALVERYTAAGDFLVSIPVTNRRSAAARRLIGYFGNTLLLRPTPHSAATFGELVAATERHCREALAHGRVGIDRIVREANPERVAGRDGMDQLVRLGFSTRESTHGFTLDGVTSTRLDQLGAPTAQVPLALAVVTDSAGDALVEAEYQVDVLTRPLVESMLEHYVRLLDSALAAPHRRIGDLDMLGARDRDAVLAASRGAVAEIAPTTMVGLFERSVAAAPHTLALVSDTAELTYAALDRRVNRLAHWLIRRGVGAEDLVGLRLGASIEFLVAVYAVLKAGAAYLPIDPADPVDRVDYLIEDAGPCLVLGRAELELAEELAAALPESAPTDDDRVRPLRPANLAYVIYTSGSTGRPKGVPVAHAAIAEHVLSFIADWGMTSDDRLLQSSSVGFDASLLDIFVTLALGARLVVPKPGAFQDIRYVAELIAERGVTVLHMVPSMLSTFLQLPEISAWRALRRVPVGGEPLPGEVADRFAGVFDAELRNHYGPTEAVVCATHMPVDGPMGPGIVPIGIPNRNVHAYVLDAALHLVPAGVVGELYLGGAQLARGYLGRPGLTAASFVADPFTPGARLYRSGDLVRRNEFGELEFVGRADEQVKVRGYRIELGEVEAALSAHAAVARCVVLVADDPATGPMLAAYLVPAPDRTVDIERVRAHAAAVLPDYMVPRAFAVVDEIPRTASGKLDKRALPAPHGVVRRRRHREPATDAERRMCALFARLFARDRVGADDSFFDLGGHSLLVTRLAARIHAEFGVELAVRTIVDMPTVAELAAAVADRTASARPQEPPHRAATIAPV
ncbi:amino acid adenylation domain-containing protein [Nocardia otitidiscaviarum]|nr:amino acid adenylation domain-containing protein [Nocardia otitidiscaviarum]